MAEFKIANTSEPRPSVCQQNCGMTGCGNRYCSAHPKHYQVKGKKK